MYNISNKWYKHKNEYIWIHLNESFFISMVNGKNPLLYRTVNKIIFQKIHIEFYEHFSPKLSIARCECTPPLWRLHRRKIDLSIMVHWIFDAENERYFIHELNSSRWLTYSFFSKMNLLFSTLRSLSRLVQKI